MVSETGLFTPEKLVTVTRGRAFHAGLAVSPDVYGNSTFTITGVVTDSRKCGPGSLFVALQGERTDGHLHIADAYARGSRVFLVRNGFCEGAACIPGALYIEVRETLSSLQDLARDYLARMPRVFRIGITGSNGKTTTKELVGAILSRASRTAMNHGNFNSEIGVPLSAFQVTPDDRYAVFEMAMDHEGEMDILSDIVRPDAALITNIGTAHVGRLGSQQAIAAEKKKIFSRFSGTETAFIPEHESRLDFLRENVNGKVVLYGERSTPGYEGYEERGLEGSILRLYGRRILLPLPGKHNVLNALGAVTLATELGINADLIQDGIENVPRLFGRGEIMRGRITVIQDCYNANPDSMKKALDLVSSLPCEGKKVLVLGSMKELGETSVAAHEELGRLAGAIGAGAVFFFGEEARSGYEMLRAQGFSGTAFWTSDIGDLSARVLDTIGERDLVLIKGSRGVALERLTGALSQAGFIPESTGGSHVS